MILGQSAHADDIASFVMNSLDRKVCNTLNVVAMTSDAPVHNIQAVLEGVSQAANHRNAQAIVHVPLASKVFLDSCDIPTNVNIEWSEEIDYALEYEWENQPELALFFKPSLHDCVASFNAHSPQFIVSCLSRDQEDHDLIWRECNAPFVGSGFTRWVDGQYALNRPELGLSNWQGGRLLARGGVLSGDGVHTVRLRAQQTDTSVRR